MGLEYGPDTLPEVLTQLMRDVGAPRGVGARGYDESDLADLVAGAMKQQRLLVISPREADESRIRDVFAASMTNW